MKQTDILKNYFPEGHGFRDKFDFDMRQSLLTFLKTGTELHSSLMEGFPKYEAQKNTLASNEGKPTPDNP